MKNRMILFLVTLLILILITPASLAEEAVTPPVLFDVSKIVTDVAVWLIRILSAAVLSAMSYVGKKYVVPWIRNNGLIELANEAVRYAEAELGRFNGEDKFNLALDYLKERGVNIEKKRTWQALKSAWLDLNYEMISLGLKEPTND